MSETYKLYRDLKPGETLRAGDQYRSRKRLQAEWLAVGEASDLIGGEPRDDHTFDYRRPVDAVPRDEYERLQKELVRTRGLRNSYYEASRAFCDEARRLHEGLARAECLLGEAVRGAEPINAELASLRQQLADERAEHARTMHGRDTLRAELDAARDQIGSVPMADELQQALRALGRSDHQMTDLESLIRQLQSEPRLQRVTPEAMAELEARRPTGRVLFVRGEGFDGYVYRQCTDTACWVWEQWDDMPYEFDVNDWGWFLDLSTIPKVT